MSFQGSGTGFLNYQIQNEQPVNAAHCIVQALEDDGSGVLTLNVSFMDAIHGQTQVGISVFDYSPTVTSYNQVAELAIVFNPETPIGGWASDSGSSVFFEVSVSNGSASKSYSGVFNAADLAWSGPGNQDSLAIKFASYSFQISESSGVATAVSYQNGAGTGSVTYEIGDGLSQTESASATTTSYYNNGELYSVILNLQWTDTAQGSVVVMLIVNPFTGSGIYSSADPTQMLTMMFSTAAAGSGNWGNSNTSAPTVTLEAIYNDENDIAQWQGSLRGAGLVWQGTGSQTPLDVNISALTLTVEPS